MQSASTGGMDIPLWCWNHYFKIPVSVSMYVFDFLHPFGPGSREIRRKGTLWPDPGHDLYTGFR